MHYYGTRLSENISRREPEGYLLCLNVPVARTGTQEYLPEELGLPAGPALVPVYRPEEEVFSPETMASFEGMPVTNDHPPEGVDVSNIRALQKGHAHNVRRGSGEESDLLLADLIITDPGLIDLILEEGKREISCGYTYELHEENGRYVQRKIRGNHVAVVDAGRAGPRVCIKDEHPAPPNAGGRCHIQGKPIKSICERSTISMKKTLVKKLARMARDGDPEAIEAVAELLEEMAEGEVIEVETPAEETEAAAEAVAEAVEEPAVVVETPEGNVVAIDEETASGILERLDRIIALLTPSAGDEEPADDPVEEIVEAVGEAVEEAVEEAAETEVPGTIEGTTAEEVAEMVEEIVEPTLSAVLEPERTPEEEPELLSADALRAALNRVRPALSRMSRKQRRKVAGDIAAKLRRGASLKETDHRVLASLADRSARKSADGRDLAAKIMASRNPNYRK